MQGDATGNVGPGCAASSRGQRRYAVRSQHDHVRRDFLSQDGQIARMARQQS